MLGSRRDFLRGSVGALGVAGLVGPWPFLETKNQALAGTPAGICGTRGPSPYGPLFPTKDLSTGLTLIMLPRGFSYWTMSWRGDLMDDGNRVPRGHDGMAVVQTPKSGRTTDIVLIRNHEVFGVGNPVIAPDHNYDSKGGAGVTTLVWRNGALVHSNVSISGTVANCAGGATPWGTWLTCEEEISNGDRPHGYVFECTPARVTNPTPLPDMGRMAHEAIAVDPRNGTIYLTEDNSAAGSGDPAGRNRGQSGFYKFVPNNPLGGMGSLEAGGKLYMLRAVNPNSGPVGDLRDPPCWGMYNCEWVLITSPNAPRSGNRSGPYTEGRAGGATRFQRLEGCWWDAKNNCVYFIDTEGGPIGAEPGRIDRAEGVVWKYDPQAEKLTAVFVSQGALVPSAYGSDNPDNVTVSPRGGVLCCEDGNESDGNGCSMFGLLPNGQSYEFARNIIELSGSDAPKLAAAGHDPAAIGTGDFSGQEWAGATFDPTGRYLFVNIQTPGITFVITGPWNKGNL